MKYNAPGQLLGYSIQYPRALCHLLRANSGDYVCIEVLGDVASVSATGETTSEEDKSSLSANPITDRSVDLWKTFANWIDAITSGNLVPSRTRFVLYCNKTGKPGLAAAFSAANNSKAAKAAVTKTKKELNDLKAGHAAWEYFDKVVNQNENLLLEIVERFELQTGVGAGYDEVYKEVRNKLVPESHIDWVIKYMNGWLVQLVSERIAANQPAIITWKEFAHQWKVPFDRARRLELIDFALESPLDKEIVANQRKERPKYLHQLEIIEASDDEVIEAVTDFLKAKYNRDKWIEAEIIDESSAEEFENKLFNFWKNKNTAIGLTNSDLLDKQRGQLLFAECKLKSETIRNESPPCSTIAGTYHAMANVPSIGWHPNWKSLIKE